MVVAKAADGLHSDQWFHISGLYDNLRADFLIPHVENWNFRPLGYRVVLGVLTVVPLNIGGWTAASFASIAAAYSLLWALSVIVLVRPRRLTDAALTALALLIAGAQNSWTTLSADELAGFAMMLAVLAIVRAPPVRGVPALLVAATLILGFFLLKGVTLILVAPVAVAAAIRWGLKTTLASWILGAALAASFAALALPREIRWLTESQVYHADRPRSWGWDDLAVLADHDMFVVPTVIGLLVLPAMLWRRRAAHVAAVTATAAIAAVAVDALQGTTWSYHAAPLYAAIATGLLLLAQRGLEQGANPNGPEGRGLAVAVWIALIGGVTWVLVAFGPAQTSEHPVLRELPGIGSTQEVLYLTYGTDRAATGYPFACSYFSAHPLQRVTPDQVENNPNLASSRALLRCAIDYAGPAVLLNLDWFDPEDAGYERLTHRLCTEWQEVPLGPEYESTQVLLAPGSGTQPEFCSSHE
ncbi:MAG: hypothetical protein AAGA42_01120 [Actinomycetota bacterium]